MKPKTKAPAPKAKLADPRNEALARMAELLKTVKTLDRRVTKLLNQIARLDTSMRELNSSNLVATDNVVWLRYTDAHQLYAHQLYMVPCDQAVPGAIGFVPLSPQQYDNALLAACRQAEDVEATVNREEVDDNTPDAEAMAQYVPGCGPNPAGYDAAMAVPKTIGCVCLTLRLRESCARVCANRHAPLDTLPAKFPWEV